MKIGIHSFAALFPDAAPGATPSAPDRMACLLDEIQLAKEVGLDFFGIGDNHRVEFLDSATATRVFTQVDGKLELGEGQTERNFGDRDRTGGPR